MRMAFFMLKKGICKKKVLLDINLMLKRAKLAAATRGGVVVPSHLNYAASDDGPREYEFSCTNTPLYRHYFTNKRKSHDHYHQIFNNYYISSPNKFEDTIDDFKAINQVLETTLSNKNRGAKQLRITDSPYPLQSEDDKCDQHVDEAAEEFIKRFYSQLKEENC